MTTFAAVIIAATILAAFLALNFWAAKLDRSRIESYLDQRGSRLIRLEWVPCPRWGWHRHRNDRTYRIGYIDAVDNEHEAYCRTSAWSGVYFTQDEVVIDAAASKDYPSEMLHYQAKWFGQSGLTNDPEAKV